MEKVPAVGRNKVEIMSSKPQAEHAPATVPFRLRELLVYFLRLGTFGFGGPIALAGYMQKDLVEERRWISNADYLEGLAFAQLSPGPLAADKCNELQFCSFGEGKTSVLISG